MEKPTIVCLCGSGRFQQQFAKANLQETLAGRIVLAPGAFPKKKGQGGWVFDPHILASKPMLDELHLRKIDLAGEILVVNPGDYIGESTSREINYARDCGKKVRYLYNHRVIMFGEYAQKEGQIIKGEWER